MAKLKRVTALARPGARLIWRRPANLASSVNPITAKRGLSLRQNTDPSAQRYQARRCRAGGLGSRLEKS